MLELSAASPIRTAAAALTKKVAQTLTGLRVDWADKAPTLMRASAAVAGMSTWAQMCQAIRSGLADIWSSNMYCKDPDICVLKLEPDWLCRIDRLTDESMFVDWQVAAISCCWRGKFQATINKFYLEAMKRVPGGLLVQGKELA